MRINIVVCLLACLGLYSCYETYPGMTMDMSGDNLDWGDAYKPDSVIIKEERLPIILSMIDPSFTMLTSSTSRGLGAFDTERPDSMKQRIWDEARFYVFGLRKGVETDFSATRTTDSVACLIDNALARVPDVSSMMMTFEGEYTGEKADYFYSNKDSLVRYNFYAYYLDDLNNDKMVRTNDSIYVPFDIDGSQDLLTGMARLTKKQVNSLNITSKKDTLLTSYYSTYTARKGLFPVLDMNHQLARLKLYIYPAEVGCDSIKIEKVEVEVPHKGRMIVAHKDSSRIGVIFDKETKWLSLHDEGGIAELDTNKYFIPFLESEKDLPIYERSNKQVGESFLLPPDSTYHLKVTARMDEPGGKSTRYTTEYNITYSDFFKPNYEYKIRLAMYGPKEIEMSALLVGWKKGEDIFIDEDDLFKTLKN